MTNSEPTIDRAVSSALAEAAATAGHAPSVHNTQPWRWRVRPDRLDLLAARERQLTAVDPRSRLLLISCGAALHHARLALAAEGWAIEVRRLPDPQEPDLLASIFPTGRTAVTPEAMRLVQVMQVRHTDRRPVADEPVPAEALKAMVAATEAAGSRLQVLDRDQVITLASAATRAAAAEAQEPDIAAELAYWTGRAAAEGMGLPANVLPEQAAQTTVPARDFGRAGTLPVGPGHDQAAVYAVLYGDDDETDSWLRAGEALSAAWLTATSLGVSVVPLSGVIEVTATRETLRRELAGVGYPYLVLRTGIADPEHAGPPRTPRMAAAQTIDTSAARDAVR
jgi:nitroreductase